MELIVRPDGMMSERSVHDLAEWYAEGADEETFEAHLMMLRAYSTLVAPPLRGRRTPLSSERYSVLRLLYRHPDRRLPMGEIGRSLNVSATSITKLVNSLVALKLVTREADPQDRRRTWVAITAAGSKLVEDSLPDIRRYTRARWRGLTSEEKRTLVHILTRLMLSNQPGSPEGRP